jgi:hypothetical protein
LFSSKARAEEAAYRLQHDHGARMFAYAEHGGWHLTTEPVDEVPTRGRERPGPGVRRRE